MVRHAVAHVARFAGQQSYRSEFVAGAGDVLDGVLPSDVDARFLEQVLEHRFGDVWFRDVAVVGGVELRGVRTVLLAVVVGDPCEELLFERCALADDPGVGLGEPARGHATDAGVVRRERHVQFLAGRADGGRDAARRGSEYEQITDTVHASSSTIVRMSVSEIVARRASS